MRLTAQLMNANRYVVTRRFASYATQPRQVVMPLIKYPSGRGAADNEIDKDRGILKSYEALPWNSSVPIAMGLEQNLVLEMCRKVSFPRPCAGAGSE